MTYLRLAISSGVGTWVLILAPLAATSVFVKLVSSPNPTFSTGGLQARESAQNRGLDPKGLHYMTDLPEPAVPPAAVILGGGCGGNARFNCCKSIFCSLGSSV